MRTDQGQIRMMIATVTASLCRDGSSVTYRRSCSGRSCIVFAHPYYVGAKAAAGYQDIM
jgi:hypothetical protein